MRNRCLIGVIIFLCLTSSGILHAQNQVVFGKASMEDLQMTSYREDSTAEAVILSDIGEFDGRRFLFSRHIRIKILKKSGLDWGNWTFNTPAKGDFKVFVFNLVDGEIVKDKADHNSIYNEQVIKGFDVYKVFAPNVKVGSVIDIFYSFQGIPYEWRFQERIPIAYNKLTLWNSNFVSFSKAFFGFEQVETVSANEWRATHMPAFKTEPDMNNYSNYITKFEFYPESINGGWMVFDVNTSWKNVVNKLLEIPRFGGILNEALFLNEFASATKKKDLTTPQKIDEAFKFIQNNIKWNGQKRLFGTFDLRNNFLVNHSGSSAEINLSLIALLNKMDITTYPVVLSTRENGMVLQHVPMLGKLNYVVGYVQHEGIEMLLDATSENITPGILPEYCLNGQGLLVKKDNEQWLTLIRNNKEVKKQFITINIGKDGNARAKINQERSGYGFLTWIETQKSQNYDVELYKNKLQEEFPEIDILSYSMNSKDVVTRKSKETIEVDFTNQLVDFEEGVFFTPFLMFEYAKNSFKSEDRKYPVDLIFPKELTTTIVVNLPKEFSIKKLPESIKYTNTDGSASFTYMAQGSNSGVQFKATLNLHKSVFTEMEYLDLRRFFSEVSKKVSLPLELMRNKI